MAVVDTYAYCCVVLSLVKQYLRMGYYTRTALDAGVSIKQSTKYSIVTITHASLRVACECMYLYGMCVFS